MRTLPLSVCLALATTTIAVALAAPAAQAQAPAKIATMPSLVYFDYDNDELSAEMRAYLDVVADTYRTAGQAQVMISAHADRREARTLGKDYVVGLSQRRANNVRSYLSTRGVPDGVMTTEAFGASRPTSDTSTSEDRRVRIEFTAGSGW